MAREPIAEINIAYMLAWRLATEQRMGLAYEKECPTYPAERQRYINLGLRIRSDLKSRGFEEDCEIDVTMELMARSIFEMSNNLMQYIDKNSPELAEILSYSGDDTLRDWQDANSVPIRPDRKH